MGNSCTSSKTGRNRFKSGKLFVHSKTQKIAYQGDSNGISPVTTDSLQMSTQTGTNSIKEVQRQALFDAQIGTPVSGQAYKNYIKIQINNIPLQTTNTSNIQSKFSQQPNKAINKQEDEGIQKQPTSSPSSSNVQTGNQKVLNMFEIRQRMQEYYIDQGDNDVRIKSSKNKKSKDKENILKDFTKRERGMWRGPTQNSLFDAFYLAFSLNEDLVLNPHDIWDQILITLKQFYHKNNIHSSDLFPTAKKLPKESKVINYKENSNFKNKRELISWDQILKQIKEHNDELLQTFTNETTTNQDNAIYNHFKIKRISQFVYNQLIYLDSNLCSTATESNNLPFKIFPGHNYQIRNIVFRSSLSDWFLLREKILNLIEVAPEFWIERLYFIVDNFVDTLQGKLNHTFWNQGLLMRSTEYPDCDLWKFGWMKELFNIEFDNNQLYEGGQVYSCNDISNHSMSRPFVFRIQEHKIDINMNIKAHKSCLISPKNLPNSFEPLLTMYLMSSNNTSS